MKNANYDTTNLEEIRNGARFTWGRVVKIHDIGRYSFVEFYGRAYENGHPTGKLEEKTSFHVYVDGKSQSNSCGSLESALILAIAFDKLEINHAWHMASAVNKILELND